MKLEVTLEKKKLFSRGIWMLTWQWWHLDLKMTASSLLMKKLESIYLPLVIPVMNAWCYFLVWALRVPFCGSRERHPTKLTRPVEPECRDHCCVLQSFSISLKCQIRRLGNDPTPVLSQGRDWVRKGQYKDAAALRGGDSLCWMDHCSHTAQASAQVFSEEVDFEGNPIDGIWPNPLPVMLDSTAGWQSWSSVLKCIKLTPGKLAEERVMKRVWNGACALKRMQWV